jgi:two-component system, NarL family, response regulator NreC
MNKITILLADDHRIVREGFRAVLEREKDFQIVGETGDGLEAVRLAEKLQPQVMVVDLMMPGLNGRDVIRQVVHRVKGTKLVVLSMHASEGYVLDAMKNGASAYVVKDASSAELVRAVREAVAGRRYLSPPLSEPAIAAYLQKADAGEATDAYESLSNREREIFQLAAEGFTTSAIATRLFLSPRTVETHRSNFMRKLNLHSQTDLIRFALQRGLLPMEP